MTEEHDFMAITFFIILACIGAYALLTYVNSWRAYRKMLKRNRITALPPERT